MKKIFCVVCILVMFWFIASFIDVNTHNDVFAEDFGNYASWNMFELFLDKI